MGYKLFQPIMLSHTTGYKLFIGREEILLLSHTIGYKLFQSIMLSLKTFYKLFSINQAHPNDALQTFSINQYFFMTTNCCFGPRFKRVRGSGSIKAKNDPKKEKMKKFNDMKSWLFSLWRAGGFS
jgi:hypothetical protein